MMMSMCWSTLVFVFYIFFPSFAFGVQECNNASSLPQRHRHASVAVSGTSCSTSNKRAYIGKKHQIVVSRDEEICEEPCEVEMDDDFDEMEMEEEKAVEFNRRASGKKKSKKMGGKGKADLDRRSEIKQYFRQQEKTAEYAESNYWKVRAQCPQFNLVVSNEFWADYATYCKNGSKGKFISKHFAKAAGSFAEVMFAFSVLDLPFTAPKHKTEFKNGGTSMIFSATSPAMVFSKQIMSVKLEDGAQTSNTILVAQHYFDPQNRHTEDPETGEQIDQYVTGEFLSGRVYGCQLVVTNTSSARQRLDFLMQIPKGSIPVSASFITRTKPVSLDSYSTTTEEYLFYFPRPGEFPHYPAHISKRDELIAWAQPSVIKVVKVKKHEVAVTWSDIAARGTEKEVFNFLEKENVYKVDLTLIAWRMKNEKFAQQVWQVLEGRNVFDFTLWGYAVTHKDARRIKSLLMRYPKATTGCRCDGCGCSPLYSRYKCSSCYDYDLCVHCMMSGMHTKSHSNEHKMTELYGTVDSKSSDEYATKHTLIAQVGPWLNCELIDTDPITTAKYEHLEYWPLTNARAHRLGKERKILNNKQKKQYQNLLLTICHTDKLKSMDVAGVVYHMLLQDRRDEAAKLFERIAGQNDGTLPIMLKEYLEAYLDFCMAPLDGVPAKAKAIAAKYKSVTIPRWRKMFDELSEQLHEIEEGGTRKAAKPDEEESRDTQQSRLASLQPAIDFKIKDKTIALTYRNVTKCHISFFKMDIELLFSVNPFVKAGSDQAGVIMPNYEMDVRLYDGQNAQEVEIPPEMARSNAMIEVTSHGVRKTQSHFANALAVTLIEQYGQVLVSKSEDSSPLPCCYVKVYSKTNSGETRFFKDGYTDRRGRFDYATLSTDALDSVSQFALLILHDEFGAVVRECGPPKR